jgi:hypothetical protein
MKKERKKKQVKRKTKGKTKEEKEEKKQIFLFLHWFFSDFEGEFTPPSSAGALLGVRISPPRKKKKKKKNYWFWGEFWSHSSHYREGPK